jgi:hypothetical protein
MQDSLLDYANGKADIRSSEDRLRHIEAELASAGKLVSLLPLNQTNEYADRRAQPSARTPGGRRRASDSLLLTRPCAAIQCQRE